MDTSSLPVVNAGFPSPAEPFIERRINTQDLLVPHPDWTFFAKADGESMSGAGIHPSDVLVIDRSLDAEQHAVVVVVLNGSFVVKRIQYQGDRILLLSEHHRYPPILVDPERDSFSIFGVVTWSLHSMNRKMRGPVVASPSTTPTLPPAPRQPGR